MGAGEGRPRRLVVRSGVRSREASMRWAVWEEGRGWGEEDGRGRWERSVSLSRLCFFHGDGCSSCVVGVAVRAALNVEEKDEEVRASLVFAAEGLSLLPRFFADVSALRGVAGRGNGSAALDMDTSCPPWADGKYDAALLSVAVVSMRDLLAATKLAYSASLKPRPRFAISAFSGEISSGDAADVAVPLKNEEEAEEDEGV